MRRKSFWFGIGVLLLVGGIGAAFVLLLTHEPAVYARTAPPDGDERKQLSGLFKSEFLNLYQSIHSKEWTGHFTEKSINSYFEDDFVPSGLAAKILPEGVTSPRVAIDQDKIRLAFRYRVGPWSTIISIEMRVWLATKKEPNVIGLELQGLHAGSVPIAAQSLLDQISETAEQNGVKVIYYRYNGNPVALLRFQPELPHPTIQFTELQLHPGEIYVKGHSIDLESARAPFPEFFQTQINLTAN